MPRVIEFIKTTAKRCVVLVREGDATVFRKGLSPDSETGRASVCRALKCDDKTLLGWLDEMESKGGTVTIREDAAVVSAGEYVVRDFVATTGETHLLSPVQAATVLLPTVPREKLLVWADMKALCCLDVDYHGCTPPRRELAEAWVRDRMAPKPLAWHFSRSGGLHLFYAATPPFTAEALAAAAAVRWRSIDPVAGLELKKQVRGPGAEKLHVSPAGQDTRGALSAWIGAEADVDESAVDDWLADHDVVKGSRYGHEKCPIAPKADTSATGDPVTVGELGVYCHRCAGHGLTLGSRKPGFVPWGTLVGAPAAGDVGEMVRNMAHWGHAGVVLRSKYNLPDSMARLAYECALTAYHEGDERIPLVFHPDTMKLTRNNDSWVNLESNYIYAGNTVGPILMTLPQCLRVQDGKTKVVASTVAYLSQGHDLSDRGYRGVKVVHGYPLARQFLPVRSTDQAVVSVLASSLREAGSRYHPKYIQASQRKPVEWACETVERVFPGVCWRTVRALLCASGVAQETRLGLHPLLFIAGPSGTSKTMVVKLAAAILGARTTAVTYTKDESRLKQAVKEATGTSALVSFDEFLKESKRQIGKWEPRAAFEPFLTITPDTACHVLYTGSRRLGAVPAMVITEPICPPQVKDYLQIARRLRFCLLHGRKKWEEPLAVVGITAESMPRLRAVSDDVSEACDVIMSDVIDRYFSVPMTWDAMADDLGVRTVEKSEEFPDVKVHLRRFYTLICTMPAQEDRPRTRWLAAKGWRRIGKSDAVGDDAEELRVLYEALCDGLTGADWGRSEILGEQSWDAVLGVSLPVQFDLEYDRGSNVYVRFRVGLPLSPSHLNGAIRDPSTLPA